MHRVGQLGGTVDGRAKLDPVRGHVAGFFAKLSFRDGKRIGFPVVERAGRNLDKFLLLGVAVLSLQDHVFVFIERDHGGRVRNRDGVKVRDSHLAG